MDDISNLGTMKTVQTRILISQLLLFCLHTDLHKSHQGDPQPPSCLSLQEQRTLEIFVLSGSHPRSPSPPEPKERRRKSRSSVLLSRGLSRSGRTSLVVIIYQQQHPAVS